MIKMNDSVTLNDSLSWFLIDSVFWDKLVKEIFSDSFIKSVNCIISRINDFLNVLV